MKKSGLTFYASITTSDNKYCSKYYLILFVYDYMVYIYVVSCCMYIKYDDKCYLLIDVKPTLHSDDESILLCCCHLTSTYGMLSY